MKNNIAIYIIMVITLMLFQCNKGKDEPENNKPPDTITLRNGNILVNGREPDTNRFKIIKNNDTGKNAFKRNEQDKSLSNKIELLIEKLPETISPGKVVYPEEDKKAGIQGDVMLKMLIDKNGDVKNVEVIKREGGSERIEKAAIEAAYGAKFKPAITKDGKAVDCSVVLPYKFRLR
jgi:TonB family protein